MSSQLYQAVQLAQAGQREEANRLLQQVVRSDPHNEVAWLWLASVANDQDEYLRSLHEVLRINPNNQRALTLMADFRAQYGDRPVPPSPYGPPPRQTPPTPPGSQAATQARYQAPAPPPAQQPSISQIYPRGEEDEQRRRPRPRRPRRRVWGCLRSCLLYVLIFLVLPAAACVGLSYTDFDLGPFDTLTTYLPREFGEKNVSFKVERYDVEVTVPRSWYPAITDNLWWGYGEDTLDRVVPFQGIDNGWRLTTTDLGAADINNTYVMLFLETSYLKLREAGAPTGLYFHGLVTDDFTCEDITATLENDPADLADFFVLMPEMTPQTPTTLTREGGLCGAQVVATMPFDGPEFEDFDPPAQMRYISFVIPVDGTTGARWQIFVPEDEVDAYQDAIDTIIETASVTAPSVAAPPAPTDEATPEDSGTDESAPADDAAPADTGGAGDDSAGEPTDDTSEDTPGDTSGESGDAPAAGEPTPEG